LNSLNHTQTRMGFRLLRMNILQPLCVQGTIECRLDAVSELNQSVIDLKFLKACLKSFVDIDHLLSQINQISFKSNAKNAEHAINHVLSLKTTLKKIQTLREPMSKLTSR
jgi:DNA mismatch repair protein MSH4